MSEYEWNDNDSDNKSDDTPLDGQISFFDDDDATESAIGETKKEEEIPEEENSENSSKSEWGKFSNNEHTPTGGFLTKTEDAKEKGFIDENNEVTDFSGAKENLAISDTFGNKGTHYNEASLDDNTKVYESKAAALTEPDGSIKQGGGDQGYAVDDNIDLRDNGESKVKFDQDREKYQSADDIMDDPEAWESANVENAMFEDLKERGKFHYDGYEEDGQKYMFDPEDEHKTSMKGFYNVLNAGNNWHVDGENFAEQYKNHTGIYAPKEK